MGAFPMVVIENCALHINKLHLVQEAPTVLIVQWLFHYHCLYKEQQ